MVLSKVLLTHLLIIRLFYRLMLRNATIKKSRAGHVHGTNGLHEFCMQPIQLEPAMKA